MTMQDLDVNFTSNTTSNVTQDYRSPFSDISWDDATWILTSSFIIFTMQSGFGLLESGSVNLKNEVNIMVKNVIDVAFGGLTFWMLGFGFAFGDDPAYSNPFCGWGFFFTEASDDQMGWLYSFFFFQLSFATTSTTVVSGCMAERTKLSSYIVFSIFNTFVYCLPAHWIWSANGWLHQLGAVDIAGAGPVHLVGGTTGLIATLMLKPRLGRFDKDSKGAPPMGCPTNALLGMFMLWWGWLGFNCGSTFGISQGKWKLAARAAVNTVCASMAGGIVGMFSSYLTKKKKFDVGFLINSILSSLVGITGVCALVHPWESFIIGASGGLFAVMAEPVLNRLKIDDPVGVIPVHFIGGIWGMLVTGLFPDEEMILTLTKGRRGLFKGGGPYLLGIQTLATVTLIAWSALSSFVIMKIIDVTIGLRMSVREELLGADWCEHGIGKNSDDDDEQSVNLKCPSLFNKTRLRKPYFRRSAYGYRPKQASVRQRSVRAKKHSHNQNGEATCSTNIDEQHDVSSDITRSIYLTDGITTGVASQFCGLHELQHRAENGSGRANGLVSCFDSLRRITTDTGDSEENRTSLPDKPDEHFEGNTQGLIYTEKPINPADVQQFVIDCSVNENDGQEDKTVSPPLEPRVYVNEAYNGDGDNGTQCVKM